jgi:hypothetical protein
LEVANVTDITVLHGANLAGTVEQVRRKTDDIAEGIVANADGLVDRRPDGRTEVGGRRVLLANEAIYAVTARALREPGSLVGHRFRAALFEAANNGSLGELISREWSQES